MRLFAISFLIALSYSFVYSQSDGIFIQNIVNAKTPDEFQTAYEALPAHLKKINGQLLYSLLDFASADGDSERIRNTSALIRKRNGNLTFDSLGVIMVEIGVPSYEPYFKSILKKNGVSIYEIETKNTLSPQYPCYISFDKLIPVSRLSFVKFIEPAGVPFTNEN